MVHKGKYYEQFLYRDLCGELPQQQGYSAPKWAQWGNYGKTSDGRIWLAANTPTSGECERIDMEPKLQWIWDLHGTGSPIADITFQVSWDALARTVSVYMEMRTGALAASAEKTWTQPPILHPLPDFSIPMLWDYSTTDDPTWWDWGTGSVETLLRMDARRYPNP